MVHCALWKRNAFKAAPLANTSILTSNCISSNLVYWTYIWNYSKEMCIFYLQKTKTETHIQHAQPSQRKTIIVPQGLVIYIVIGRHISSKQGTLTQWRFVVGPASQTMGKHQTNIGSTSRVCCPGCAVGDPNNPNILIKTNFSVMWGVKMFVFSVFGGFNYAVVYSLWTTDGIGCTLGGTSIRKSIEYHVLVAYTCTLYRYVYVRPLSMLGHYDFFSLF